MNILLTGGAGYIGSHTAISLSEMGHEVVIFDNLINSNADVLKKISQILDRDLAFIEGDVRDTELLKNVLKIHKIHAVIHFAGLKAVGESNKNPIEYYANNVQGTISLLEAMTSIGINKLVFSSSATVYGEPQYLPMDEGHPLAATNPYGRTKLHIEEILKDVALSDLAWHIVCLRYFNPVGAHESGLIGEDPRGIPNNLVPYIGQVACGIRSDLAVFGDDYPTLDGTGVRDYIHVMDLAEGHAKALDFLESNPGWNAINLGTGKGYSVFEVIEAFENASSQKIPYRVVPRRMGDVPQCYANPEKAKIELDWTAHRTLDDMCLSAWNFQKKNV